MKMKQANFDFEHKSMSEKLGDEKNEMEKQLKQWDIFALQVSKQANV